MVVWLTYIEKPQVHTHGGSVISTLRLQQSNHVTEAGNSKLPIVQVWICLFMCFHGDTWWRLQLPMTLNKNMYVQRIDSDIWIEYIYVIYVKYQIRYKSKTTSTFIVSKQVTQLHLSAGDVFIYYSWTFILQNYAPIEKKTQLGLFLPTVSEALKTLHLLNGLEKCWLNAYI